MVYSPLLDCEVVFVSRRTHLADVDEETVAFWPDELADIVRSGPEYLRLLHETKRHFGPQVRTRAELKTC